jgi:hypothetical protein
VGLGADASGSVFAARDDQVFRTIDGGATWTDVSGGAIPATILCLHVTPAGHVFAGLSSRGLAWSFDGGATWDQDQITRDPHGGLGSSIVAVGARDAGVILAGAFRSLNDGATWLTMDVYGDAFAFDVNGDAYAGTSDGVHVSSDAGASWLPRNAGIEGLRVVALTFDSSGNLWAGTVSSGVFRSDNLGVSWTMASGGLPTLGVAAVMTDFEGRVFVALSSGGLYRTDDAGATWTSIQAGLEDASTLSMVIAPGNVAYAGGSAHGVRRSTDHGATWSSAAAPEMVLSGLTDLIRAPATGHLFLSANGGGVYHSTDGGATWEARNSGLATTDVGSVAAESGGRLYAATGEGVFASDDEGGTWVAANAGHEGISMDAVMVDDQGTVFAVTGSTQFTFAVLRSTDDGASWQEVLTDSSATFPTLLQAWTLDPGGRVFLGGMSVAVQSALFVSEDAGDTWTETDLAASGVLDLASDSQGNVLAVMADNTAYLTTDHGASWTFLPSGSWPTGTSGVLDVAGFDRQDALLVSSSGSGIWRSDDGGQTWSADTEGLPVAPSPVMTFLRSTGGAIFAGTFQHGLYRRPEGATAVGPGTVAAVTQHLTVDAVPNPFNPSVTIHFTLAEGAPVTLTVHDAAGRLVRTLEDGRWRPSGAGEAQWDGGDEAGREVASGVYFVCVRAGAAQVSQKIVLVR